MSATPLPVYLDEDVSVLVAKMAIARGFQVTTTQQAGRIGATDAEQLAFAAASGMALLTHNRVDFEALARAYVLEHRHHAGILLAVRRPPREIAHRLCALLSKPSGTNLADQVRYL